MKSHYGLSKNYRDSQTSVSGLFRAFFLFLSENRFKNHSFSCRNSFLLNITLISLKFSNYYWLGIASFSNQCKHFLCNFTAVPEKKSKSRAGALVGLAFCFFCWTSRQKLWLVIWFEKTPTNRYLGVQRGEGPCDHFFRKKCVQQCNATINTSLRRVSIFDDFYF